MGGVPQLGVPMDPRNRPPAPAQVQAGGGNLLQDLSSGSDAEKAKVIQQVMKLTDAQINQLPPDQRQSIVSLREQILKSQKR